MLAPGRKNSTTSTDRAGGADRAAMQGGSEMRDALRGMDFASGAAALSPFVQRKPTGESRTADAGGVARDGFAGGGDHLPHLGTMERSFGTDLSGVRAHTGPAAQQACQDLGARAYAFDGGVAFADAAPSEGIVAHEVTHVLQHRGAGGGPQGKGGLGAPNGGAEQQADRVQQAVESGGTASDVLASEPLATPEGVQRFKASDLGFQLSLNEDRAAMRTHFPIIPSFTTPKIPIPIPPTPLVMSLYGSVGLQGSYEASTNAEGEAAHKVGIWGPMRMFISGGLYEIAELYGSLDFTASGSANLIMGDGAAELELLRVDMAGGISIGAKLGPGGMMEVRIPITGANLWWMELASVRTDGSMSGFDWGWGDDVLAAMDRIAELYDWVMSLPERAWDGVKNVAHLVMNPTEPLDTALQGFNDAMELLGSGLATIEEIGDTMRMMGECVGTAIYQARAYELGYLHSLLYQSPPRFRRPAGDDGEHSTVYGVHRDLVSPFEAEYRRLLVRGRALGGTRPPLNHFAAFADKTLSELAPDTETAAYIYDAYTENPVPNLGAMTLIDYFEWLRTQNWVMFRRDPAEAGMTEQAQADSALRSERGRGCDMGTLPEEQGEQAASYE